MTSDDFNMCQRRGWYQVGAQCITHGRATMVIPSRRWKCSMWPSGILCTRSETVELCLDSCMALATTPLDLDIL